MFWSEGEAAGPVVVTENDLNTYTHIIYLDIPAGIVAQRIQDDKKRIRPKVLSSHLHA